MQNIAAGTVPLDKLTVNMLGPWERLVAFGIGCVDIPPRGQHKHRRVKAMCLKCGLELGRRQWRNLVNHGQRLNKSSIEEDPASLAGMSVVLLDVATKNLPRERNWLRTRGLATRPTLRNDCSGGLGNRWVTPCSQLGKQRRLTSAGASGDEDAGHRYGDRRDA